MRTIIELILSLFGGGKDKSMVTKIVQDLLLGKLMGPKTAPAGGDAGAALPGTGSGGPLDILFDKFKNKGMGDVFGSWVGNGKNQSISADQVQEAIGDEHMSEMAQQSNMSVSDLAAQLSKHLPGVIDKMTPGGRLPGQ
jgi:uncharacterized protein YidB (DUF937 family)